MRATESLRAVRLAVVEFLLVVGCAAFAVPATAGTPPRPVSPGGETSATVIETRCPTFSWSGVLGASGYDLAVFTLSEASAEEPQLVARATVPGDARSFTPPLGQCLERGGRYAWSVGAIAARSEASDLAADTVWSPTFVFSVAAAPSDDDLRDAIATIERHLELRSADVRPGEAAPATASTAERRGVRHEPTVGRDSRPREARPKRESAGAPGTLRRSIPGLLSDHGSPARVASAGSSPTAGAASLSVSGQVHLGAASHVFKGEDLLLWEDGGNTALGRNALSSATTAMENTAVGSFALLNTTTGYRNIAIGDRSLQQTDGGGDNTAVGSRALRFNTDGAQNIAVGSAALYRNETGSRNVAVGHKALVLNTTGNRNSAFGAYALGDNTVGLENTASGFSALYNTAGTRNIGLGYRAGFQNVAGSNGIFIGNDGSASDTGTIRIGTTGTQTKAFLAGDVALGFTTGSPDNRLHVRESINNIATPANHVAQLENTSTGNSADVLALKVGLDHVDDGTELTDGVNFVTFFDGGDDIVGEIQGTVTGGIELVSGNADFAEWLPRLDTSETLEPGDVVGLHGGALSKRTVRAERVFVLSTGPIVTGNDPGESRRDAFARVAFLGQVPVRVRGSVRAGDLLVASGRGDGVAVARRPDEVSFAEIPIVVGRAMEDKDGRGTGTVRVMVGLDGALPSGRALDQLLERLERRLGVLEAGQRSGADEGPPRASAVSRRR